MKNDAWLCGLLGVLMGCAGQPSNDSSRAVEAPAATPLQTSWKVSYSDRSANAFTFWMDGEVARFSYEPVSPLTSSSGIYSGGDPREGELTPAQLETLRGHIDALWSDKSAHTPDRIKGTGAFMVDSPDGARRFNVVPSALDELEAFLAAFRGGQPHMIDPAPPG